MNYYSFPVMFTVILKPLFETSKQALNLSLSASLLIVNSRLNMRYIKQVDSNYFFVNQNNN